MERPRSGPCESDALERGETVEAIQASFVADFGTQVLMAPPREGFNLVGYFLPGVGILTIGILVGFLIQNGAARRERPVGVMAVDEADQERRRRPTGRAPPPYLLDVGEPAVRVVVLSAHRLQEIAL